MREEMKKYLECLSGDEEAKEKLKTFHENDREGAITANIEIAKGYGINLVKEDFEEEVRALDADELDSVVGGVTACACVAAGFGTSGDNYHGFCACAIGGGGEFYTDETKKYKAGFCRCPAVGGGGAE